MDAIVATVNTWPLWGQIALGIVGGLVALVVLAAIVSAVGAGVGTLINADWSTREGPDWRGAALVVGLLIPLSLLVAVVLAHSAPTRPNLDVKTLGLSQESDKKRLATRPEGQLIGQWRDEVPFLSGLITIRRQGQTVVIDRNFDDGSRVTLEVSERKIGGKRRFDPVKPDQFGAFYVMNEAGELELHDREGLIRTAVPLGPAPEASPTGPSAQQWAEAEATVAVLLEHTQRIRESYARGDLEHARRQERAFLQAVAMARREAETNPALRAMLDQVLNLYRAQPRARPGTSAPRRRRPVPLIP